MPLIPYIIFPGTCREAMKFYRDILGGEITLMQTYADSPVEVSRDSNDRIFNSELVAGDFRLKASDDLPNHAVTVGSNISLFAVFSDEQKKTDAFARLAAGGKVLFPLEGNFGMVMDKYEIRWMVVHDE